MERAEHSLEAPNLPPVCCFLAGIGRQEPIQLPRVAPAFVTFQL